MSTKGALPLDGLRVLELGHIVAGPSAGLLLPDLGADVIKVERVGEGDQSHTMPAGTSALFHFLNRNKRSIAIDLKGSAEGRALFLRLAVVSDVLIDNFAHGAVEALGLGYDVLARANPGLIYLALKIKEVGPREGFQFEKDRISLAAKISLVDALTDTGVKTIEFTSFVSPKWVPQMADAEQMVDGIKRRPGVEYEAIWLNLAGLERAAQFRDRLHLRPMFGVAGSDTFMRKNTNRSVEERIEELPSWAERYQALGMDWIDVGVMAAFGCNYEGDVEPRHVVRVLEKVEDKARDCGSRLGGIGLADTMGWANPLQMKRVVGLVRERWPETPLKLHLHDTRALAIANVVAALEMGIDCFDSAVAGMGGCPFAAHKGAAGNITTEDLVFLCHELGIDTGIDLDAMIEAGQLAERVVGHPLPGKLKSGGNLEKYRARARAAV